MSTKYQILVHVVSMFDDSEICTSHGVAEIKHCSACGSTAVNVTMYGYTKQARGKVYGYSDIDVLVQEAAGELVRLMSTSCDLGYVEYLEEMAA